MNPRALTRTTLVTGSTAAERESRIAQYIVQRSGQRNDESRDQSIDPSGDPHSDTRRSSAGILEGLAGGHDLPAALTPGPHLHIVRIAPGCVCCTGNLTLRVTLNRLLRTHPAYLYIGLASTEHLPAIQAFLLAPEYASWLTLEV